MSTYEMTPMAIETAATQYRFFMRMNYYPSHLNKIERLICNTFLHVKDVTDKDNNTYCITCRSKKAMTNDMILNWARYVVLSISLDPSDGRAIEYISKANMDPYHKNMITEVYANLRMHEMNSMYLPMLFNVLITNNEPKYTVINLLL